MHSFLSTYSQILDLIPLKREIHIMSYPFKRNIIQRGTYIEFISQAN